MAAEPVKVHGVVREGVIVLEAGVALPEGVPVLILVNPDDLPGDLHGSLAPPEAAAEAAGPGSEQWERQE